MTIRVEDIAAAHLLRSWSDEGTLLDLFTLTESVQVRIRVLDIVEGAGAQFIGYELELVETNDAPAGPTPVVVVDLLVDGIRVNMLVDVALGADFLFSQQNEVIAALGADIQEDLVVAVEDEVTVDPDIETDEAFTVTVDLVVV